MTTVSEILDRAARQCSLDETGWLGNTSLTALQFRDFLDQTISDIQDRLDLIGPMSKTVTISGNGSETYALPGDFLRLNRGPFAVLETQRSQRRCQPITEDGVWRRISDLGLTGATRYYRLQGYDGNWTISFLANLANNEDVAVNYVSTVWLKNQGQEKSDWTQEDDVCLYPRRLVETGIIWRYRLRKGLVYADARSDYEAQMVRYSNDSRSYRDINFGPTPRRSPFDVPVPDFIPPT
jgi:hypothetical protein